MVPQPVFQQHNVSLQQLTHQPFQALMESWSPHTQRSQQQALAFGPKAEPSFGAKLFWLLKNRLFLGLFSSQTS